MFPGVGGRKGGKYSLDQLPSRLTTAVKHNLLTCQSEDSLRKPDNGVTKEPPDTGIGGGWYDQATNQQIKI